MMTAVGRPSDDEYAERIMSAKACPICMGKIDWAVQETDPDVPGQTFVAVTACDTCQQVFCSGRCFAQHSHEETDRYR